MAVRKPSSTTGAAARAAGAQGAQAAAGAKAGPENGSAADPAPAAPASSPGLELIKSAVSFNRQTLTAASASSAGATADAAGEQAAALMVEDLRSYMQGSEQMVLAASGQAMAMLLDPATQETGTAALTALAAYQTSLIAFAGEVVTTAGAIKGEFAS